MSAPFLAVAGPASTKSPEDADLARFLRIGLPLFLP